MTLFFLTLFGGSINADALSNPLAGKPWGFDDMLPYMSEKQLIYRSGTGDNGENPLGIVVEPSDNKAGISIPNWDMNSEDILGIE